MSSTTLGWLNGMPGWFKTAAVIFGLLSLGASAGKGLADYTGHKALIEELKLLRHEAEKQTCLQVSQLRHTDWTLCLESNAH